MPWREAFYRHLAPIANRWQQILDDPLRYPAELPEFLARNRAAGQTRPLSRLQRLRQGDEVGLHQHVDGDCVFPLQVVALLSEPGRDFTGGEFVMTEQRPRMQSRPIVLPLGIGDAAIIGAGQRPFKAAPATTASISSTPSAACAMASASAWNCCCTTRPERRLRRRPGAFPWPG